MHCRPFANSSLAAHRRAAVAAILLLAASGACCGGAQTPPPHPATTVANGAPDLDDRQAAASAEETAPDLPPPDPDAARARSRAIVERAALAGRAEAVRMHLDWALIDAHTINDVTVLTASPDSGRHDEGALLVATAGGLLFVEEGFIVDRSTALEGLPDNAVRSVHLDDRGVLWLAFAGGGCRRRVEGELEGCPAGLADQRITAWDELNGDLYALTWEGLLWRVERPGGASQGGPVAVESVATGSRPLPFAGRLLACDDRLWVGTLGSGVGVFDPSRADAGGAWQTDDSQRVVEDLACQQGTAFAGGPGGLVAYAPSGSRAGERLAERRRDVALGGGRQRVTALAAAEEGLYVGIADGSIRLFGDTEDHFDLPGPVSQLAVGGRTLWAGGEAGLYGIARTEERTLNVVELPGPGSTDVTALASFGDQLVLGLFRAGLASWEPTGWRRLGQLDGLPSDEVNALAFDRSGRLWVGTSAGLVRVAWVEGEPRVESLAGEAPPCHHINAVTALSPSAADDEQVVAASSCGVFFVDADSLTLTAVESRSEGLPHRIVYSVAAWGDLLVAGTNDGLAVRDGSDPDRPWTAHRAGRTALVDNWITAVATTPEGGLAVGTYSGGLYRGAGPESLARLEGPRYINPSALLLRGADLYAGGLSEGAYRVVGDTVHRLTAADCLLGDDVTAFTVWRGDLLVATRSGVARLPAHCAPGE